LPRPKGFATDTAPVEDWEYDLIRPKLKEHWQLFYDLLWQIGPRVDEALQITKPDLVDDGVWIIRSKRKDHIREHLPLTPDLYSRLLAHIWHKVGIRVFPYGPSAAWLALHVACVKVEQGYPGFRTTIHPHSFRHSVGYRIAGADLGLKTSLAQEVTVQHVLGHTSLSSAQRYFNPPPASIIKAIQKINEPVKIELPPPRPAAPDPGPVKVDMSLAEAIELWRKENK
jgi:integrase